MLDPPKAAPDGDILSPIYDGDSSPWPLPVDGPGTTLSPPYYGGDDPRPDFISGLVSSFISSSSNGSYGSYGNYGPAFNDNNNQINNNSISMMTSFFTSTMTSNLAQASNHVFGDVLFAYTSPFLIFLGLVGNLLSLIVFMFGTRSSKVARSQYLLCLGISDSIVLLSYVLPEWVKRGITTLDPTAKYLSNTVYDSWRCYTILFLSYSSRFISAWLRVVFTFERFFSIRFPFKRLTFANRVTRIFITMTIISGLLISSLKPPLMQSRLNLELNAAATTGTAPSHTSLPENYDIDIKQLLTSTPPGYLGTTQHSAFFDLSLVQWPVSPPFSRTGSDDQNLLQQMMTTGIYSDYSALTAKNLSIYDIPSSDENPLNKPGVTTTQVDHRMLQALLHVFGSQSGSKNNAMNSSEFIDAMLGEATPNPVCVVRPEYRRYGELYDTLYFGVFIMLLPFLLIIIFDFNVLYVVRHREGHLLTPTATTPSSASSSGPVVTRKGTLGTAMMHGQHHFHQHQDSGNSNDRHNAVSNRSRVMSLAGPPSRVPDKLAVMLVLSSCFILLNLPYFVVWSIYSYFIQPGQTTQAKAKFTEMPTDIFNNLSFAARTISGLTYSVNGIIYFVSDRAFRADFVGLLKKCWSWRHNGLVSKWSSTRHSNVAVVNNHTLATVGGRSGVYRVPSNATSAGHRSNACERESLISPSQSYNSNKALLTAQQSPKSNKSNNNHDAKELSDIRDESDQTRDSTNTSCVVANGGSQMVHKNGSIRRIFAQRGTPSVEECLPLTSVLNGDEKQPLSRQRSVHFADEVPTPLLMRSRPVASRPVSPAKTPSPPRQNSPPAKEAPIPAPNSPLKSESAEKRAKIAEPEPSGDEAPESDEDESKSNNNSDSKMAELNSSNDSDNNVNNRLATSNNALSDSELLPPVNNLAMTNNSNNVSNNSCNDDGDVKIGSSIPPSSSSMLVIYCELESCI